MSVLKEWRENYPFLFNHIQIQNPISSLTSYQTKLFFKKRQGVHQRQIATLEEYGKKCQQIIENTTANIEKNELKRREFKVGDLIYDRQEDNLAVLKVAFLKRKIMRLKYKLMVKQLNDVKTKLKEITLLLQLLCSEFIPTNCIVSILNSFYIDFSFEEKSKQKLESLIQAKKRMKEAVDALEKPLWVKGFKNFFKYILEKGIENIDPDFFYFPPLKEEISLSRYLFCTKSKIGMCIDQFLCKHHLSDFEDFQNESIDFCSSLLPKKLIKKSVDQSVGLLLLFRVLMDRLYETFPNYFSSQSSEYKIVWKASKVPLSFYNVSMKLFCDKDPSKPVKDIFLEYPYFRDAIEFINMIIFYICPIDILSVLNQTNNKIHICAIINMNGKAPDENDLKTILAFDDLFSLLLGIIISSDIPDIFQIQESLQKFAPKGSLSTFLQYAYANIEAIILYFRKHSNDF